MQSGQPVRLFFTTCNVNNKQNQGNVIVGTGWETWSSTINNNLDLSLQFTLDYRSRSRVQ